MSYYGYKKRDNGQQVDWGKLGSDMAKGLKQESDARVKREEDRTKDFYETVKSFEQQELGQNQSLNTIVMEGADNYRNIAIEKDKLMRAGLLKPSDMKMFNQTARDDFKTLNTVAKTYQAEYAKAQEEMAKGNASAFTAWNNMSKDEYGNLADKTIYVNPETGRVYIAKVGKDGKVSTKPGDLLDVNSINARLKDRYDKIDVAIEVNKYVKNFQDYITASGLTSINDIKQNENYPRARDGIIAKILTDPRAMMSVLSDNVGDYDFETDPEKAKGNPNIILMVPDKNNVLQPEITPEQKKVAEDYIEAQIESQLKLEEEVDQPRSSGGGGGSSSSGGYESNDFGIYYLAVTGDTDAQKALRDRSDNIKNVFVRDGVVYVELKNKEGEIALSGTDPIELGIAVMGYDKKSTTEMDIFRKRHKNKKGTIPKAAGGTIPEEGVKLESSQTIIDLGEAMFKEGSSTRLVPNKQELTLRLNSFVEALGNAGGSYGKYSSRVRFIPQGDYVRAAYYNDKDKKWYFIKGKKFEPGKDYKADSKITVGKEAMADINRALEMSKKAFNEVNATSTLPVGKAATSIGQF